MKTGVARYLVDRGAAATAAGLAATGTLCYVLGMRHAFDADHVAAIDNPARLLRLRGEGDQRYPVAAAHLKGRAA